MTARESSDWPGLKLGPGARLLLGWRDGRNGLAARPVHITDDIAATLIDACEKQLARMVDLEGETYSGRPSVEPGQYLSLGIEPGPAQSNPAEPDWLLPEETAATAELLGIIDDAFENEDWLARDELRKGKWLFYALVAELHGSEETLTFVRRYNPQRGLAAGRLQLAARGSTLRRFSDPLFNLDLNFDLIITGEEIAILSVSAFNSVFADIEVAKLLVPDHVRAVTAALALSVAHDTEATLLQACGKSTALANRLRRLAHARYLEKVDFAAIQHALSKHQMPKDRLGKDSLALEEHDDVEVLFDLLEGLYYEADFTGEARKATRFSVRK
ncbi:MAG: hypothetical protein ACYDHT_10025 [Solirubrobacteraceae bacterium]